MRSLSFIRGLKWRDLDLYGRLLISYLLVVATCCLTFFLASEAFAPLLFEQHIETMMTQLGTLTDTSRPEIVAMETDLRRSYREATEQAMRWGIIGSVIIAGVVSLIVTWLIVSPLRKMKAASSRVASGRYHERLSTNYPGEIGALAGAFNEMAGSLEQTEQRRVELLNNVAHEFKTPLSSLHGYLEGLEDGLFEADAETLTACQKQVSRLERLVGDISLLSKVESRQDELNVQEVQVGSLLEQQRAAFRPQFEQKGVTLTAQSVPDALTVRADPTRSAQVLANLIDNALRHTPSGGEVRLNATSQHKEVRFEVTDTGEGVAAQDLPHLFTRFYRADKARGGSNSGIGLTIAKHYVQRQGGRIGVESIQGRRSCFWFTLPTHDA